MNNHEKTRKKAARRTKFHKLDRKIRNVMVKILKIYFWILVGIAALIIGTLLGSESRNMAH